MNHFQVIENELRMNFIFCQEYNIIAASESISYTDHMTSLRKYLLYKQNIFVYINAMIKIYADYGKGIRKQRAHFISFDN